MILFACAHGPQFTLVNYSLVWRAVVEPAYDSAVENHRAHAKPGMQQPPTHVVDHAKLLAFSRVTVLLCTSYSSMEFFPPVPGKIQLMPRFGTVFHSFSVCMGRSISWSAFDTIQQAQPHHQRNKVHCIILTKKTATMQGTKFDHCRILVEVITSWTQKHRNLYSTGICMMPHSKSYKSKLPKARPGLPLSSWFAQCCCQTHGQSVISTSLQLFKMN